MDVVQERNNECNLSSTEDINPLIINQMNDINDTNREDTDLVNCCKINLFQDTDVHKLQNEDEVWSSIIIKNTFCNY